MKLSQYNILVDLDNKDRILYNTLNRNYFILKEDTKNNVDNLLKKIENDSFTREEFGFFQKLINKRMILKDDFDEIEQVKYLINSKKFKDTTLSLTIQPTLDCNFRCIYCYEKHNKITMNEVVSNNIINYINNIIKDYSSLKITWYGGEPLLEFQRIYDLSIKFKEICFKNNIKYYSSIVTNGYLLDDTILDKLDEISLNYMQITLDGSEEHHNIMRPLATGEGTYKKILENIIKVSQQKIQVIMRITVNEYNYKYIHKLFDEIPSIYRNNIIIGLCNVIQSPEKKNLFELYNIAIKKGYKFIEFHNNYLNCEFDRYDTIIIEPNGKVSPCSVASESSDFNFGYINENGKLNLTNPSLYFKFKNLSAFDDHECINCIEFPMCVGGCAYSRIKGHKSCRIKSSGLSLEDNIRLHYYNDVKNSIINESYYL